jgi:hypothetical protein
MLCDASGSSFFVQPRTSAMIRCRRHDSTKLQSPTREGRCGRFTTRPDPARRRRCAAGGDHRCPVVRPIRAAVTADLPCDGPAAGGVRRRDPVRGRPDRACARLRRAGDHPDRGRFDHPLERGPAGDAGRGGAGDPRRDRQRRRGGLCGPLHPRPGLADLGAPGRRHLADRRRRGLLRTAPRPRPSAAPGDARGRVGAQRRPNGPPGDSGEHWWPQGARPAVLRRPGPLRARDRRPVRLLDRLGGRRPAAQGRARLSRSVPAGDRLALFRLVRRWHGPAARLRVRRRLRDQPDPRPGRAAAPDRDPVVRRRVRLAGADRAVS